MKRQVRQGILVFISFLAAYILMIIPIPLEWRWIRPDWLLLVLIYWIFANPRTIGLLTAWCLGLVMDGLDGAILGQYALSMVIVAFLARILRHRLRLFLFWQQALIVFILIGCGNLGILLVQWLMGHPPRTSLYWASTVFSVLLWPWLNRLMRMYEHNIFE